MRSKKNKKSLKALAMLSMKEDKKNARMTTLSLTMMALGTTIEVERSGNMKISMRIELMELKERRLENLIRKETKTSSNSCNQQVLSPIRKN